MEHRTLAAGIVVALGLMAAPAVGQSGLIAYDGFNSGPRLLDGATGGSGWAGPWRDLASSLPTSIGGPTSGLTFAGLATAPGGMRAQGGSLPDMVDFARAVVLPATDTVYISCLLRPETDKSNWQTLRIGVYPRQIDFGVPIGYTNYGFMLGDGFIVESPNVAVIGQTSLLVVEIRYEAAAGRTVYSLFVDPTPGQARPATAAASFARAGAYALGSDITYLGEGGYTLDELRIGTTWGSVTPAACRPDFDGSGGLAVNDIFAFLNAWFAGDARADFNGGGLAVSDIFDFLSAWFTGC